ncbi:hypothetical protein EJB05_32854, partial [Eragrostis curvula]
MSAAPSIAGSHSQQHPPRGRPGPPPGSDPFAFACVSIISCSLISLSGLFLSSVVHQVPEGYVGVYWRGGALLNTTTPPGFLMKLPWITKYEPIQITLQTDQAICFRNVFMLFIMLNQVRDIPCGTKGGVMISFDKIEVVNRLRKVFVYETLLNYGVHYDITWIYDKIHHEINQFCSAHSLQEVYIDMFDQIDETMKEAIQRDCTRYVPAIEIISILVTKPNIPASLRRYFELMEEERTKLSASSVDFESSQALIAIEKQKIAEKEAETQQKIAVFEAEKNAQVSKILMEQKLMEGPKRQQETDDEMYLARERAMARRYMLQLVGRMVGAN